MERSTNKATLVFVFSILVLFSLNIISPVVSAAAPRSGRVVVQDEIVNIQAPPDFNWTVYQNIANSSDNIYLDYNLTWAPFLDENPDLVGIIVHNYFAPATWALNTTDQSISVGSFFRMTPEQIMDGASEVWFRFPVTDIPVNATLSLKIWKARNPFTFNLSFVDFGNPLFCRPQDNLLVHSITIDPAVSNQTTLGATPQNAWVNYLRWLNVSVPNSTVPFWFNFTYMKACFGLFPNEWYFVEYDILAPYADSMKILLSAGDFGSDDRNNTWLWLDSRSWYFPIDLDTAFVCTYGVSNGITGIGVREDHNIGATLTAFHMNASIPIDRFINETSGFVYFNVVVPFLQNTSYVAESKMQLILLLYESRYEDEAFAVFGTDYVYFNATYNFFIESFDLTAYHGRFIHHIRAEFRIYNSTILWATPMAEAIKLWGTQKSQDYQIAGFTDLYWRGYDSPTYEYVMHERQFFIPFGYFSLDNSYWVLTDKPIMVIPINTPKTELGILEAIQKFEAYLYSEDETGKVTLVIKFLIKIGGQFAIEVVKSYSEFCLWAMKTYLNACPWWWLFKWGEENIPGGWEGLFNKLLGIGQFVWDVIKLIFDALEWFVYWAVRIIYGFSIAVVYMVNVFGVISINSALFNVGRTGNGKDFVRAFRAGWKFVFAIISLLLSLAILAVTIVGAVVPF